MTSGVVGVVREEFCAIALASCDTEETNEAPSTERSGLEFRISGSRIEIVLTPQAKHSSAAVLPLHVTAV
jgi:hypothetical protein